MAFLGAFSSEQQYPETGNVLFTDLSTGSDVNITERRIYPRNAAGELVLPAGNTLGYISWPLPLATPITVDLLPRDIALNVEVIWLSSSPLPASDYDVTNLFVPTKYTKAFVYNRSQDLAAQPSIGNDTNWFYYYSRLQSDIDTAILAGTDDILDISDAQMSLDDAYFIMTNQSNFF